MWAQRFATLICCPGASVPIRPERGALHSDRTYGHSVSTGASERYRMARAVRRRTRWREADSSEWRGKKAGGTGRRTARRRKGAKEGQWGKKGSWGIGKGGGAREGRDTRNAT